ncbi:flagellar biosynthesis anti-sigma factor FlgM [uncultured Oxalicibacterium sp.]|uniref:flagellar biosynthesis anti-sigma factor FlgM n=1 Tax=uncultured Oxalicibacterium sp. TaxID=1168540 RepID=UPI0025D0958B|nr:flagellar biosynthesis anti-sigma factor FlgM [uncultured Oxalicibacterium sp.]
MKIDDASKKIAGLSVGTTATRAGKGAEKTDATGKTSTDNVTLSTQAQALSQSGSAGVFDAKKVDEIKAAIAGGQFKVNAESVADGLMDTVKDLISTRR